LGRKGGEARWALNGSPNSKRPTRLLQTKKNSGYRGKNERGGKLFLQAEIYGETGHVESMKKRLAIYLLVLIDKLERLLIGSRRQVTAERKESFPR